MLKATTIRINEHLIKELRHLARQRSAREDRSVSWLDLLAEGAVKLIEQEQRAKRGAT